MEPWEDILSEHDRRVLKARAGQRREGGPLRARGLGQRPALLNIDMNIGAVGEDRPIYEQLHRFPSACGPFAWAAIPHQQKLLAAARAADIPVIYSNHILRAAHGMAGHADRDYSHSELSAQSDFQPEVAPQPGDLIIEKEHASVFFATPLLCILMQRQIDTLVLMGNSTSGCVRATAVDGSYYPAFSIFVVEETVFDRFELSHKAALFDMDMKYAKLVSTAEVLKCFQQVSGRAKVLVK